MILGQFSFIFYGDIFALRTLVLLSPFLSNHDMLGCIYDKNDSLHVNFQLDLKFNIAYVIYIYYDVIYTEKWHVK